MINSYQRKKQKRIKEMVKRFHFDPQAQSNMNKSQVGSIPGKQKISQIINKDQNGQYSSVKQKNQFNDSSWLAKLVNGIEECQGPSVKHLSDVQNLNSLGSQNINCKLATEGEFYTITRKSSDNSQGHIQKLGGRKSVPSITNFRNQRARQNKLSCHTISIQNENRKQPKQQAASNNNNRYQKSQNIQNGVSNIENKKQKIVRNMDRNNRKKNRVVTKQQQCENIKNSLINYSSIKQEDRNSSPNQQSPQKIIIDLDEISLHTQVSKQATPIHARNFKTIRQPQQLQVKKELQQLRRQQSNVQEKKLKQTKQNRLSIQFSKNKSNEKKQKTGKKIKEKQNIRNSDSKNFIKIQEQDHKGKISKRLSPGFHQNINPPHDCKEKQKYTPQNCIVEALPISHKNSPHLQKQQLLQKISQKSSPAKQTSITPLQDININNIINDGINNQLLITSLDKDRNFSSHNEFLDTFKQQPIAQCVMVQTDQQQKPIRVGGIIKKNKKNSQISRIQVKQLVNHSEQARIPTFSERPPFDEQIGVLIPMSKSMTGKETSTKRSSTFSPIKFGYQIKKQNLQKDEKDKSISTIKKGQSSYTYYLNQKNENNHNLTSQYHPQTSYEGLSRCHLQQSQSYSEKSLQKYKSKCQQAIQSPKFNYKVQPKKQNERPGNKILNYDEIFKKLDMNKQHKLHKSNCNQAKLTEEQRYQIGPILSKIKYLDRLFTENQFALQCMKIKNSQIKCQKNKINDKTKIQGQKSLTNYHTFQPNKKQQKVDHFNKLNSSVLNPNVNYINSLNTRSADRRKEYMKQNEHIIRGNIISSKNNQKAKKYRKYSDKRQQQKVPQQIERYLKNQVIYKPLFPQTYQDQNSQAYPSRSPYLQMPSFPSEHHQQKIEIVEQLNIGEDEGCGKRQKGDIGTIIDNLNTKLSNYIQNNNLEDTYRKFKLQFVQLRRNMPY